MRARSVVSAEPSDPGWFVRSAPSEAHGTPEFRNVLRRWARESPADALEWLESHSDCERFGEIRDMAMTAWARLDPEAALKWALTRPAGQQARLFTQLAIGFADVDPGLAASFADQLPPGAGRRQALEGVAVTWAEIDPAAAASWALSGSGPVQGRAALDLVLYTWFDQAPSAAEQWTGRLSVDSERDRIYARLVGWQLEKNPAGAVPILERISDPTIRAGAASSIVRHWARDDFDVAGEWVLGLPDSPTRTRLISELAAIADELRGEVR